MRSEIITLEDGSTVEDLINFLIEVKENYGDLKICTFDAVLREINKDVVVGIEEVVLDPKNSLIVEINDKKPKNSQKYLCVTLN